MEETISRLAGSYHGVRLDPPQLIAAAHAAGRPAAERTTLYEIRRHHPVGGCWRHERHRRRRGDHRPGPRGPARPSSRSSRARAGARWPRASSAARELGDLKENAEYHIAKEDQAHLETKIKRLTERLRSARRRRGAAGGRRGRASAATVHVVDEESGRDGDLHARRPDRGRRARRASCSRRVADGPGAAWARRAGDEVERRRRRAAGSATRIGACRPAPGERCRLAEQVLVAGAHERRGARAVVVGDVALEAARRRPRARASPCARARSAAAAAWSATAIHVARSSRPRASVRAAPVLERREAGDADRDVGLAVAPRAAERVGDDDGGARRRARRAARAPTRRGRAGSRTTRARRRRSRRRRRRSRRRSRGGCGR